MGGCGPKLCTLRSESMGRVTRTHSNPYTEPSELRPQLQAIENLIITIRDSTLTMSSKKRMLNHALWEVSHARGNYAPQFRSVSVVRSAVGTKIERDHVYKRKKLVQEILQQDEPLSSILSRVIHCVVTEEEHGRLTRLPENIDGWERYASAEVDVHREV